MLEDIYQRKLSVIVSADIAGYAKLTELNEADTHNALQKRLELVRGQVSFYNGQVFRIHGDGCLCSFDSVVGALKACLEIQHSIQLINSGVPKSHQMWLRIGINISEIILDQSEPYGNGVNIAVRLQHSASPGEILVSKKTIELLGDEKQFVFSSSRKFALKNISCKVAARKLLGVKMLRDVIPKTQSWVVGVLKTTAIVSIVTTLTVLYVHLLNLHDINFLESFLSTNDRSTDMELKNEVGTDSATCVDEYRLIQTAEFIASKYVEHRDNNIRGQVNDVVYRLIRIEDSLQTIKYQVDSDSEHLASKLIAITDVVGSQQNKLIELSNARNNSDYMLTNFEHTNELVLHADQKNNFESVYSQEYVVDSIDSLDELNSESIDSDQNESGDIFACLSCIRPNSFS